MILKLNATKSDFLWHLNISAFYGTIHNKLKIDRNKYTKANAQYVLLYQLPIVLLIDYGININLKNTKSCIQRTQILRKLVVSPYVNLLLIGFRI